MSSQNEFEQFCSLYESELSLLANPVCLECDAKIRHPLLPYHVGDRYWNSSERILFVGKSHRGIPGTVRPSGVQDARTAAKKYFFDYSTAYWIYTREIATRIYGDGVAAWDHIAMTNLIKCTNVEGEDPGRAMDATTQKMASSCVSQLQVLAREICLLKPYNVVCYTYSFYRDLLPYLVLEPGVSWFDVTSPENRLPCGAKSIGWWDRRCSTSWCSELRFLVVGHPERMAKKDYTEKILKWLKRRDIY